MATQQIDSQQDYVVPKKQQAVAHPLNPLSGEEIRQASAIIKSSWPAHTDLRFKTVTLNEPAKKDFVPYLEAEHSGATLPRLDRKAFVAYYIRNTDRFHEAVINLSTRKVEFNARLGANVHGNADYDEILQVEEKTLNNEQVKAFIAKLQLPKDAIVTCDPWIYGSDGNKDDDRLFQVFVYMRDPNNPNELDSNHYAFPLPITAVFDASTLEVISVDWLPIGADATVTQPPPYTAKPPNEYIGEYQQARTDLKPLNVIQPEGASFTLTPVGETGHVLEWQKWFMRIGFNQREGPILYDVRYDGRPLFYRVSMSDMNIPYADPRSPYHKKSAFDLGDAGAGAMANNLQLGCDCLGHIAYLDGVVSDDKGSPVPMENAMCVHEQDAGIGWKHTNYRTGRAAVTRARELVIQTIITVSNYEYIMAFQFNTAAEFHYEVRATGILSTQPIDHSLDKVGVPFGTVVHPGVLAAHHQHIFSLRIDPMIDGSHSNRLAYSEAHAMPISDFNPYGHGYVVNETPVTTSGGLDLDFNANRVFKIQNHASRNAINNHPVGYKIMVPPFQPILADPSSYNFKRAEFSDHPIYVTTHGDRELYAGGWYTNQSRGGTGVRAWADRKDNVLDQDIVVWVQFGINHVPRIEDFPVMPCEILKVALKPVNFFDRNPAADVPMSEQRINQSTLVNGNHAQGAGVELKVGECCNGVNGEAPSSKL